MNRLTTLIASMIIGLLPQQEYRVFTAEGQKPISVHREVGNQLLFLYGDIDRELPMCLMGTEDEEGYKVERLAFPVYASSTEREAGFVTQPCLDQETEDEEYLGVVHNHGVGSCNPSMMDVHRFMGDNDSELEMVVCKADLEKGELGLSIHSKELLSDFVQK